MPKFGRVAFKPDMILIKGPENNGKGVWYNCSPQAKGYAKATFYEDDEVELVLEQRDGKPFVTQVKRPGQGGASPASAAPTGGTSAPSGASTPNQGARPAYGQKTPEESEKITRLSVMSSATQAVQVMTGRIESTEVLTMTVLSLYKAMLEEIKK